MNIVRFLKPAVFLFECIKLGVSAILIIQGDVSGLLIKIILAAPGALFPIMALFIWIDTDRYREYLPLFSAGKCIGIFLLLGWLIVFRQVTMIGKTLGLAIYAEALLLGGDLLSLGAVLLINRNVKKMDIMGIMEEKEMDTMEEKE
jgi:predicted membrane channel-forming protein YqfA (hemolysin III family)